MHCTKTIQSVHIIYLTSVLGMPTTSSSLFLTVVSSQPILSTVPLLPSAKRMLSPSYIESDKLRVIPLNSSVAISLLAKPKISVPVAPTLNKDYDIREEEEDVC